MFQKLFALRGPILGIHVVMAMLSFAVIGPLSSAAIRLAITLSGKPALTDMEIARFFLTPAGLACMVLGASILIVFASLEIAALLWLLATARPGDRGRAGSALWRVAKLLPRLLWIAAQLVVRLLAVLAPFAAVLAAIAYFFLRQYDINYYLSAHPPEFFLAVALAVPVIAAAALVAIRQLAAWVFILPVVMFTQTPLSRVFSKSRELTLGRRWLIGRTLAAWGVFSLALAAAVSFAFHLLVDLALPEMSISLTYFVWLGALLLVVWTGLLMVTGAVSAAMLAGFIGHVARSAGLNAPGQMEAATGERRLALWAGVALFVLASAGASAASIVSATRTMDKVEVIAHRGAAGARPENTMASVLKAIEDGADWVEVDVQETADGEVVVMHDSDFMKLAGNPLKVWQASAAQVAQIDIGSWFGPQYAGERPPTLRAVLLAAKGRAKVLVELKYYGHDERLAERVAGLVEETGMQDATAFMSLEPRQVAQMKELRPQWRVGTLAARTIGNAARLQGDFLAVSRAQAKPAFIGTVRSSGRDIYVWTVDDPITMSQMISRGANGLITNEPALAREVIAKRSEMSILDRLMLEIVDLFGVDPASKTYRDNSP